MRSETMQEIRQRAYIDVWQWYNNAYMDARFTGDSVVQQLGTLMYQFFDHANDRTALQNLTILEDGIKLAAQHNKAWWYAMFEVYRLRVLLYETKDYESAFSGATKLLVEMQKPVYQECPFRIRAFEVLATAYNFYDPTSYGDDVLAMIDYALQHVPMDKWSHQQLVRTQTELNIAIGQWAAAHEHGLHLLALATTPQERARAGFMLCQIAFHLPGEMLSGAVERLRQILDGQDSGYYHYLLTMWQLIAATRRKDRKAIGQSLQKLQTFQNPEEFDQWVHLVHYYRALVSPADAYSWIDTTNRRMAWRKAPYPRSYCDLNAYDRVRIYYLVHRMSVWGRVIYLGHLQAFYLVEHLRNNLPEDALDDTALVERDGLERVAFTLQVVVYVLVALPVILLVMLGGATLIGLPFYFVMRPEQHARAEAEAAAQQLDKPEFFMHRIEWIATDEAYTP